MKQLLYALPFFLILLILTAACQKEDPMPPVDEIPDASDAKQFVFEGLATWYFWVEEVPNLVDPKFNNQDSLNAFLNGFEDPEELFYSLLYKYQEVDKWSFIVENYQEIDDWIAGKEKSMGFNYQPVYIGSTTDIFGYVTYVLEGTPADQAGIKRGDFFTKVNNTQLTESNFRELLNSNTFTLHMANISNSTISENGVTYDLTAEVIQENPVFLDTVLVVDGQKVGYLMYNGFTASYDPGPGTSYDLLLNEVFGEFKSTGIDQLVIDLRYNGGGSIQTAIYLSSMIYSTDKNKVLAKTKYNRFIEDYIENEFGSGYFSDYFTDAIRERDWYITNDNGDTIQTVTTPKTPINTLNMDELYVITSGGTASASELLINGLDPYITVKTIGTRTAGKNVGSRTIRDRVSENEVNPNHDWAMQPIILKIANSEDFSDYTDGLPPDIEAREFSQQRTALLPLGTEHETLLKIALDDIRGVTPKSAFARQDPHFRPFSGSKAHSPFYQQMYFNDPRFDLK